MAAITACLKPAGQQLNAAPPIPVVQGARAQHVIPSELMRSLLRHSTLSYHARERRPQN